MPAAELQSVVAVPLQTAYPSDVDSPLRCLRLSIVASSCQNVLRLFLAQQRSAHSVFLFIIVMEMDLCTFTDTS
jgi:hypothetical protein